MVEPFVWRFLCSILVCSVIILLHSVDVTVGSVSGVYVDNGDQTVMHHALTADDTEEVEREILELLGLPDRPRKRHVHPSLRYVRYSATIDHFCSTATHHGPYRNNVINAKYWRNDAILSPTVVFRAVYFANKINIICLI